MATNGRIHRSRAGTASVTLQFTADEAKVLDAIVRKEELVKAIITSAKERLRESVHVRHRGAKGGRRDNGH